MEFINKEYPNGDSDQKRLVSIDDYTNNFLVIFSLVNKNYLSVLNANKNLELLNRTQEIKSRYEDSTIICKVDNPTNTEAYWYFAGNTLTNSKYNSILLGFTFTTSTTINALEVFNITPSAFAANTLGKDVSSKIYLFDFIKIRQSDISGIEYDSSEYSKTDYYLKDNRYFLRTSTIYHKNILNIGYLAYNYNNNKYVFVSSRLKKDLPENIQLVQVYLTPVCGHLNKYASTINQVNSELKTCRNTQDYYKSEMDTLIIDNNNCKSKLKTYNIMLIILLLIAFISVGVFGYFKYVKK